jgi:hypothetical protein
MTALMRHLWVFVGLLMGSSAWAIHYDIELRTSAGPVVGSRITTDFFGELDLAGRLPIDATTGHRIFPAYFSDLAGGPYLTANPGFQAFAGTFLKGEVLQFKALGKLQYWNPATGRWGLAPEGVELVLFGGIPEEIIVGYVQNPSQWTDQYNYYDRGTRFSRDGVTGPPTALIDDAKKDGSFHAHLDWKIVAKDGVPTPGVYMVSLGLWSTTLSGGQPKYTVSKPVSVMFERGVSETQMRAALDARISPPVSPTGTLPTPRIPHAPWAPPASLVPR